MRLSFPEWAQREQVLLLRSIDSSLKIILFIVLLYFGIWVLRIIFRF